MMDNRRVRPRAALLGLFILVLAAAAQSRLTWRGKQAAANVARLRGDCVAAQDSAELPYCIHDGDSILVYDGQDRVAKKVRAEAASAVKLLAFCKDRVAAASDDLVEVWDFRGGGLKTRRFRLPIGASIEALAFRPDGTDLAVGFYDGSVKILSPEDLSLKREFQGNGDCVLTLAYSPDGRYLAVGGGGARSGNDFGLRLFDREYAQVDRVPLKGFVRSVCAGGPDLFFVASGTGDITAIRIEEGKASLKYHKSLDIPIFNVESATREKGTLAASGGGPTKFSDRPGSIFLIDPGTGGVTRRIDLDGEIGRVVVSPDGSRVFACCGDGIIKLYRIPAGKP